MIWHDPHTRHGLRFPLSLAIAVSLLLLSTANAPIKAQEPEDVIRVRTDLVAVPVAVTDSRGRRIANLKPADFVLLDDNRTAKIDYFASGAERVALAFLLDNSNSLREQLARQRDAAIALFSRFGSDSSVAVIRFGQQTVVVAPFSGDPEKAQTAFASANSLSERTAIFDAVLATASIFRSRGENSSERRIAILISDGLDNGSRAKASRAIEAANQARLSVYVIQLPLFTPREGRLVPRPATKGFRDLAEKTGGRYFVAGNAQSALIPNAPVDLTPVFAAIEEDLHSQYVLGFYPGETSRDGRMHQISISLAGTGHGKFRIRQLRTTYSLKP